MSDSRRTPVRPMRLDNPTNPMRADAGADVRPDVRASTPSQTWPQAHAPSQRANARQRARAQRELEATARAYKALMARMTEKRTELGDLTEEALTAGMTLEEVQAVIVLAGLPADLVDPAIPYAPEGLTQ